MGGKTAARVKNANTKKNYDRLSVFVPKGKKAFLIQVAKEAGFESLNSYINYCINQDVASRKGPQRNEEVRKAEFIRVLTPDIIIHRVLCVCVQEFLCRELTTQFMDAEVTCCCQQDLYQFERDSFDVVVLTKSVEYVDEQEIFLTKIKDLLRKGGIFVWCFEEEEIDQHPFHAVSGNSKERMETVPKDSLVDSLKKLEGIDLEREYHIIDADRHGYEPWAYILAWKNLLEEDTDTEKIINQWEDEMSQYFENYFAASGGNPWK